MAASEFEMAPCNAFPWPMLNFAASPPIMEFGDFPQRKSRTPRDPMSHRIIEKRRRDRMNNCLADLSHLIPATYLKQQGQGRIEKTEIIEMGIKHIHNLQTEVKTLQNQRTQVEGACPKKESSESTIELGGDQHCNFKLGFQECRDEVMKFLVERQDFNASDPLCMNLMYHLQEQLDKYQPSLASQKQMEIDELKSADDSRSSSNPSIEFIQEQNIGDNTETNRKHGKIQEKLMTSSSRDLNENIRGLLGEQGKNMLWASDGSTQELTPMSVDQSGMETLEERRQDNNSRNPTYKFKNDIKLRFSADSLTGDKSLENGYKMKEGSTSLSTSDTSQELSDLGSSGNGNPTSPSVSSISEINGQTNNCKNSPVEVQPIDLAATVPGFALHPAGAYYIPVVTPVSQLLPFIQNYPPSGICHPISIPVNLGGGPSVSMNDLRPGQSPSFKIENDNSQSLNMISNQNLMLRSAKV